MMQYQRIGFYLMTCLLLAACSSVPVANRQLVTLNGKQIEFTEVSKKQPRVIFLNGGGPVNLNVWGPVYHNLAQDYSVLAYYRFGAGKSSKSRQPQTGTIAVTTLHQLLKRKNLKPPYVLVGHSLGGLYANLYARKYPNEVVAVILLDPTHPDQEKRLKELGIKQGKFVSGLVGLYKNINPTRYSEITSMTETRQQIKRAGKFPKIPLAVVSAGKRRGNARANAVFTGLHKELAALSPYGKHIIDSSSGHIVQRDNPQLVIRVIRQTMQRIR